MELNSTRSDLLDPAVPTVLVALGAGVLAVFWWTSQGWRPPASRTTAKAAAFAFRAALGTACLWFAFQTIGRFAHLAASWPLWLAALAATVGVEVMSEIYRHERAIAGDALGRVLAGLRSAAIIGLVVVLLQPTLISQRDHERQREVVIAVDGSASMGLTDEQLDIVTKLETAELFGIEAAKRENTLSGAARSLAVLDKRLAVEASALQPPEGVSPAAANTLIAKRAPALKAFLEQSARDARRSAEIVARQRASASGLSEASAQLLSDYDTRIRENIASELARAATAIGKARYTEARGVLHAVGRQLHFVLDRLPSAAVETDTLYYQSLSDQERGSIDAASKRTREAIAREALLRAPDDREPMIDALRDRYRLRFLRFADGVAEIDGEQWLDSGKTAAIGGLSSNRRTDITAALEGILGRASASDLAGVILLSDGRHNGDRPAEEGARRMGLQGIPVCSIAVGSETGPRDASILAVRAPDSIYQDDRAIIRADLKLDGLRGSEVKVDLLEAGRSVASKTVEVNEDQLRTTVRFSHTPAAIGIFDYEVAISPLPGEAFANNNRWRFQLAVSDDRTNVLLVDGYPRWEFRYLRNLFYARDKSVHLQHVVLDPDQIAATDPAPVVHASVSRKFGDAEATALPESRDEWLRFDAIVLGDVPPGAISDEDWESVRFAVAERGAMLVVIAGPRWMPRAHENPALIEMLPAPIDSDFAPMKPPAYRLRLTDAGRSHPILRQSADPAINALVWAGLPALYWRSQGGQPKPTAEVLAWAEPVAGRLADSIGRSFDTAEQRIAAERENALIITQRYALGRCVQINFDATWRLRYGVGDIYHHAFWGQMLRWGTGANLRAGTELVRLGTDRISYAPSSAVSVMAKLLDESHQPIRADDVSVSLYKNSQLLVRQQLEARPDSGGMHEGRFASPEEAGRYRLVLDGIAGDARVETEIIVRGDDNAVEFSELTASPSYLQQLAALSGGAVATPNNAESILPFLKDPGRAVRERHETALWNHFAVLALLLVIIGLEWTLRRRGGLV